VQTDLSSEMRPSGEIQVLNRAFDVLEELARHREPVGLSDIARASGLSKTTTSRILKTLVSRGYATRALGGGYTVGHRLFETASNRIDSLELQAEARPHILALQKELSLTSYLGVMDGPFISIIEKNVYGEKDDDFVEVGRRYSSHCSSMGKCMLACMSSRDLTDMLAGYELKAFTPHTITDKEEFREHLRRVREQGWASDIEESCLDHRCVAAPIYDFKGDAIAVAGVSGSNDEMPDERISSIASSVVRASKAISASMGYAE
jgi:IclR family KDG regulon transcriptional repressor